ncbi:carboxyvinyl-carboxyphosphonate phosphorylmutase [Achromobacter denitrificans]|jgi:2-methylisocitrate lyase-like PEP mutase family enzyme|uniref:isocitrate lyase/PEP mutase family protein n=1 Tax=Achromobacter denitrificans TaxID=32002 RepID=UPI000788046A|nr:isocitrate lyase/phosphoenolpyruvate mutase family protein [Achromobacter denitrificans]MPT41134.1 carboxyvinyl-carboxyphosphonate phosphorylmutase [Achromobacter sp.]MBV2159325.1 isocitrate lyase/phosphoenolpyruvate mutase family protein [Achromobacter denitrificans]OLU05720.1 carboxyvinyl-carboxyphosphonate phosphorylmutase [Achromobacter denitrificans]QCS66403.1 carboxyvinyl-carboxyphosphonate phosphorylmutase [Achromobacter denitrificans]QKH40757.1 isocitrate lyase/phosphoenolpyruvate m
MQNQNLNARLAAGAVLAPGVYDALSALIAEQAGFDALYLSGASIAYTRLGRSDIGLTTYTEVEDALARITERVAAPVIVDADTGFGNALNTQRTVRGFERAGAAMIQLEDQTFPKRCGHLDGKTVIPAAEMCGKLKAAADARTNESTLILARTDALAVEGLEAALDRAEAYLEAGADALFIEALRTPEQMRAACERYAARVPLLANMVEGGKTPVQSAEALTELGFRIVIFPGGTARAVARTLQGYYASLRRHGTTAPWRDGMLDFDGLNAVIGTPELLARGKAYEG